MIETLLIVVLIVCGFIAGIISGYANHKNQTLLNHSLPEHIAYLNRTRIVSLVLSVIGFVMLFVSYLMFQFGTTREWVHIEKGWFTSEKDVIKWTSQGNWSWIILVVGVFLFLFYLIRFCKRDISFIKYSRMSYEEYYKRQEKAEEELEEAIEKEERRQLKRFFRMMDDFDF